MSAASDRLIRGYIGAQQLVAFYVVSSSSAAIEVGHGPDPERVIKRMRRARDAQVEVVGWCRPSHAALLAVELEALPPAETLQQAADQVRGCAADLGIALQSDDDLRAIAAAAVRHVEGVFDGMLRAGKLRDLNRRYKTERLARAAEGQRMISYSRWIEAQKLAMVAATAAVGGPPRSA